MNQKRVSFLLWGYLRATWEHSQILKSYSPMPGISPLVPDKGRNMGSVNSFWVGSWGNSPVTSFFYFKVKRKVVTPLISESVAIGTECSIWVETWEVEPDLMNHSQSGLIWQSEAWRLKSTQKYIYKDVDHVVLGVATYMPICRGLMEPTLVVFYKRNLRGSWVAQSVGHLICGFSCL